MNDGVCRDSGLLKVLRMSDSEYSALNWTFVPTLAGLRDCCRTGSRKSVIAGR